MDINILDLFDRTVSRYPEKVAIADDKKSLTFSQWQDKAQSIGTHIAHDLNSQRNSPVLVFVDRNIDGLVGFMGVVESGNFYVPIDCHMPMERIKLIIGVLNPVAAIISTAKDREALIKAEFTKPIFDIDDISCGPTDTKLFSEIRVQSIDTDPVYSIFTSGSTGVPKGVVISHRGVIDLANWLVDTFTFSSDDNLGNQTPFYFDGSVKDIYICVSIGATLNVIGKKYFSFPKLLVGYLDQRRITSILWATSAIVLVGNTRILEERVPQYINKIFFAGEAMPAKQLKEWIKHYPGALYVNLYGPTEITVDCTYYVVDRDFDDDEYIPIGKACRNKQVIVLNDENRLVDGDEAGELCVRGSGVSLGYYDNQAKTDEVFVQNPINPYYRDIIYRTGDIVRYGKDGNLEFVSRKDFQIKHMGNRIELGEIEAAVNSVEGVANAACIYDYDNRKIVLFYETVDGKELDIVNLVKTKIPKYMFPNTVRHLPSLPHNMNNKIDRIALKKIYENSKD